MTNPGYLTPPSSVTYYFGERGGQRWDDVWRTDLSLLWELPLPALPKGRVFFRGVITNLFNNAAVVAGGSTILTRNNDPAYAALQSVRRHAGAGRALGFRSGLWPADRRERLSESARVQLLDRRALLKPSFVRGSRHSP